MINCRQVTRLLSDAQERKLDIKEQLSLKIHLMMCSGCRQFGQQMGLLKNITQAYVKGELLDEDKSRKQSKTE